MQMNYMTKLYQLEVIISNTVRYAEVWNLLTKSDLLFSKGLGCALYQKIDDQIKILGFGSRTLNNIEQKYHSSK